MMRSLSLIILIILVIGCKQSSIDTAPIPEEKFVEIMAQSELFDLRFKELNGQLRDSMLMVDKQRISSSFEVTDSLVSLAIDYYARQKTSKQVEDKIKDRVNQILDTKLNK
jgi:hypothetical protein